MFRPIGSLVTGYLGINRLVDEDTSDSMGATILSQKVVLVKTVQGRWIKRPTFLIFGPLHCLPCSRSQLQYFRYSRPRQCLSVLMVIGHVYWGKLQISGRA